MTLPHTDPATIVTMHADDTAPRYGNTVSGYGPKLPTRYRITFTDGRTRRVYVMQYGNSGSAYVVIGGVDIFLDIDTECALQSL